MTMSSTVGNMHPSLRYARRQGLCYDNRREDILQLVGEDLIDRGPNLPALSDFVPPQTDPPSDGKLRVSQKAGRLLVSIATQPPKPEWRHLLSDHQKLRKLKVEPPLLMTDHSKDMRKFLPKRSIEIEDIDFSLDALDAEKDEGLNWPSHISKLCSQWDDEIAHEKLQTSRETLQFLGRALRDTWTEENNRELVKDLSKVEKPWLECLSPVLMPDDEPMPPYLPSSPALLLPLTSDPVSVTSIPKDSSPRGQSYEDYIRFDDGSLLDMKLPEYHHAHFKYEDDELIDYDIDERTSSTDTDEKTGTVNSDIIENRPVNDFVSARSLLARLVVPQLALNISCERYPIPPLPLPDESAPLFEDENAHRPPATTKTAQPRRETPPTKSVAFSEKPETIILDVLSDIIIPANTNPLAETIEGLEYQLPVIKEVLKSHQMLWKPDILSLLEIDNEDEEELVLEFTEDVSETIPNRKLEVMPEESLSSSALVKRNPSRMEIESVQKDTKNFDLAGELQTDHQSKDMIVPEKRKPLEDIMNEAKKRRLPPQHSDHRFSATGSLSSFLGTRLMETNLVLHSNVTEETDAQRDSLVLGTTESDTNVMESKAPSIPALDTPRTIFCSNSHMQQHKSLWRFLETWASDRLNIIYRELEVPILLSTRHAMMVTSLQALTQRPLPGKTGGVKSAIHDQISRLSQGNSFEVLIVLVTTPFSSNEETTMLGFTAFCEDISGDSSCDVEPLYHPDGEAELQSMVAHLIIKYAYDRVDLGLQHEETVSERSLVKAGMNPFAAQGILAQLKDTGNGRPWGLSAFVQMSQHERENRFGNLVGMKMLEDVRKKIGGGNL